MMSAGLNCRLTEGAVRAEDLTKQQEEGIVADQSSFDVVSEVNMQEMKNVVDQATKEIKQRFDFKDSKTELTLKEKEKELVVLSDDEYKLNAVIEIIKTKCVKRGVSLKAFEYGKIEEALGATVRQVIKIQSGISSEKAKEITKAVKESKIKVQAQIQGEQVRVISKSKDDLQTAIAFLKGKDFGIDLQFTPVIAAPPPPIGWLTGPEGSQRVLELLLFTAQFNVTGQPAISLPLHRTADGLPVGVQLVAAFGREDVLVRVAAQLEHAAPWPTVAPPLAG